MTMREPLRRRDRVRLLAGVAVLLVLAWAWLLAGAGMEMGMLAMTAMAGMDAWLMQPMRWTPTHALQMFAMWWVMMLAMMLPAALPVLLLFDRIDRGGQTVDRSLAQTAWFGVGYLLVWGGFSAAATALQWGLETARLLSPMLSTTHRWLGAGILMAAGLWQWTPVKTVCLRHCRSPIGFLAGNWRPGRAGALRMGLAHGAYCLGCCWVLMLLLFFGGVMNLYWIAALAIYVLLEKTLMLGQLFGRLAGLVLLMTGLGLAIRAM